LAVARGNVLLADHGRTITDSDIETLDVPDSASPFRPTLEGQNLTYSVALSPDPPAASGSLHQDPREALPAIQLTEDDGHIWEPVLDLLNSDRFARAFVIEPNNDREAVLRFGDGTKGRMPEEGDALDAAYRVGNGLEGNLGRDSLSHFAAPSLTSHNAIADKIESVRNPMAAAGAVDPEPARNVALYAPEAFRTQERAVTETDYAEVSERRRDIQKAAGTRRWTGSWHTMFVTVDRHKGLEVDGSFDRELSRYLDRYRLAGQDVEVDGPRFVPLDIEMRVCAKSGYFRFDVKEALLDALSCKRRTDGSIGFFHPDNFTFGDTLYLSSLVAAAMAVAGVEWVDVTRFQRWHEQPDQELDKAKIEFGRLEIPQVENDLNAPENGVLVIAMEGGK
jgi:predicted phage baseplate assembly protein